jgi:hypothetical protein
MSGHDLSFADCEVHPYSPVLTLARGNLCACDCLLSFREFIPREKRLDEDSVTPRFKFDAILAPKLL